MPDHPQKFNLPAATVETFSAFSRDNALTWAAALAFYAGLSLAPLLTLTAFLVSTFLGDQAIHSVQQSLVQLLGPEPGQRLGELLQKQPDGNGPAINNIAGLVSLIILFFSAIGVFVQLQAALNRMWNVRQKPGRGIAGWFRKRLLSFALLLFILFLLIASTFVTAFVQTFATTEGDWTWQIITTLISLLIFIPLFALIYKYLPDVKVRWPAVWVGATITAILFIAGRFLLGLYLGRGTFESSYGAAIGSFFALLVWVYYSSVIFFLGAEATQVFATRAGYPLEPDQHAEKFIQKAA
jgi:membrane protein